MMQMAREEVAEVSYCYYSRDSCEIVCKFPCIEAAKFTDRDWTSWDGLPVGARRRFWTLRPAKGSRDSTRSNHDIFIAITFAVTQPGIAEQKMRGNF